MMISWNGYILDEHDVSLPLTNRGVLYGDGLFETLRVEGGAPILLDEHVRRLARSARDLLFNDVPEVQVFMDAIRDLVYKNNVQSGYVRLTLVRKNAEFSTPLSEIRGSEWWVVAKSANLDTQLYQTGVVISVSSKVRRNPYSLTTRHKTTSYLENVIVKEEARTRGVFELLLLNTRGDVAEGATTNVFLVRDGAVFTAELDGSLLPGVTRNWVIRASSALGIPCFETTLSLENFENAHEVFLTNATWGVLPVARFDHSEYLVGENSIANRLLSKYCKEYGLTV